MISLSTSFADADSGLQQLFKFAYLTNCELEKQTLGKQDYSTLEDLSKLEIMDNFKDLTVDLLNFKKQVKESDKDNIYRTNEQYQGIIQKLEGDVRNHISIEQQLRLHIDDMQQKVEKLEKGLEKSQEKENKSSSNLLKDDKSESKLRRLSSEINLYKAQINQQKDKERKFKKIGDMFEQQSSKMHELEKDVVKYKALLDSKVTDYGILKKEYEQIFKDLVLERQRCEVLEAKQFKADKASEVIKLNNWRTNHAAQRKSCSDYNDMVRSVHKLDPNSQRRVDTKQNKLEMYQNIRKMSRKRGASQDQQRSTSATRRQEAADIK